MKTIIIIIILLIMKMTLLVDIILKFYIRRMNRSSNMKNKKMRS